MTSRGDRELLLSLRRSDGWFTVGLVALICASLAWSFDDASLVAGREELTDFLPWIALAGALVGFVGPLVGWGRWTTHLVGAAFAALVTPLAVGTVLDPGAEPSFLFRATTDHVVRAWTDLIIDQRLSTPAYGHHLLVLGLILWGTGQFASYATFGHRRPINAVVVLGLLLLANMSLTANNQLMYLVIFSIAGLFLLVRFHTLDEQGDWLRRRIGDPGSIASLYLRGGTVFIIAAITGSLVLTSAASSAPLAGAWTDVGARLVEWGQWLQPYLPDPGNGRSLGPSFGDSARIGSTWHTNDQLQLTVQLAEPETNPPFLATVFYDRFELRGWRVSDTTFSPVPAGTDVLGDTGDSLVTDTQRTISATITPSFTRREVFIPGEPGTVSQDITLRTIGTDGYLTALTRDPSNAPYEITASVPADEAHGGWTQAKLRAAGEDYPDEIKQLYGKASLPAGAMGPESQKLLALILSKTRGNDPYDVAAGIRDFLRDPSNFTYSTDLSQEHCEDASVVECFAKIKKGFCQWYASTMAVFLQELDIPARFVQGFLPGQPDAAGKSFTVRSHDAHAWVQVYFPGYGWVDFDPTGNPNQPFELAPIPSGRPVATPKASAGSAGASFGPGQSQRRRDEPLTDNPTNPATRQSMTGLYIAIAILLLVGVGAVAAIAYRRGPRSPVSPDDAYRSIARLAARFGFAPRPTQTVYEYAGALGDELPMVRPELQTVARAKVEVAYGGRVLGDDRLAALREAHRRLRVQLLRLVMRRRHRPKSPRPRFRR
jgi:Transglutaminase-like superfamily/Domain of unknown function (DUF4129)